MSGCRSTRRRRRRTRPGRRASRSTTPSDGRTVSHEASPPSVGPRVAGALADAAPQRLAGARRRQHVGPASGRRGDRSAVTRRAASTVPPSGARAGTELVEHRRERADRQPHGRVGVVLEGGEAVERDAGRLDDDVECRGRARRWRHTPPAARWRRRARRPRPPVGRRSSSSVAAASSSSSRTFRRSSSAPAMSATATSDRADALGESRQPGSSCTAWCSPSSSRTRSSTSWAKRSVSLAPTLTSVARATSSSRRDCVRRRWSAVDADSAFSRSTLGQLLLDRRDRRVEVARSAPAAACWLQRRPAATAARSGRAGALLASISWPRRATAHPSAQPAVEAVGDGLQPVVQRSRRASPRTVSWKRRRGALAGLHELPPRLADGERVDGGGRRRRGAWPARRRRRRRRRRWRRRRGRARRASPATTPAAAPSRIRHDRIALAVVGVQNRSRNAIGAKELTWRARSAIGSRARSVWSPAMARASSVARPGCDRRRSSAPPSSCSPTVGSTACRCGRSTARRGSATRRRCSTTSATARACCGRSSTSTAARSTPAATRCSTSTRRTASTTSARLASAFVLPLVAKLHDNDGGRCYLRIAAELVNRDTVRSSPTSCRSCPTRWATTPRQHHPLEPARRAAAAADRRRPAAAPPLRGDALRPHRARPPGERARHQTDALFTSHLVDLVTSVLVTPVSAETAALVEERRRRRR